MNIERKIKLKSGEQVVYVLRRYALAFFWHFVLVLILLALPFFFMFWLFAHSWWGIGLFVLPILISLIILIRTLFLWNKNIFVLTTHRLVDFDQLGFFEVVVSDIPYDQVEDVHGRVKGVFQTIFKYGKVNVQTGNGKILVVVDLVKNPVSVQREINRLRENYLTHLVHHFSGNLADAVVDKLYELETEDLEKIKIVIEKRLRKLSEKDQKIVRS